MSKREMAAWYWAICEAAKETPYWAADGDQAIECHDAFFSEWCRLLFVEAGRPKGFPWRVD